MKGLSEDAILAALQRQLDDALASGDVMTWGEGPRYCR